MAADYYINRRPVADGKHLIHREGCPFLQNRKEEILLGNFDSVNCALEEGRKYYRMTSKCIFCNKAKSYAERIQIFSRSLNITFLFPPEVPDGTSPVNILLHCTN
ncbi:MAG TPA: hypothetical protein DDW27_11835 [Bacteroidales bacterium]|nr:hypothetical protein [Bacteroidales bacterium]